MADETNSQTDDSGTGDEGAGAAGTPDPNTVANAAAKAHVNRFAEKALPGLIAAAMKPLLDEIQALKTAKPVADAEETKSKSKGSPEMAAVQAQLEEMKTRFAAEQTARASAEKKSRDDSARTALKEALAPHVRPELLGILTDNLIVMKQVVDFDDDGTPLFKSKKADIYGDLEDVRMPLKDGVAQYLKTDEAKAFLPSPGSSGAAPLKTKTQVVRSNGPIDLSTADENTKIRHALSLIERAQGKT